MGVEKRRPGTAGGITETTVLWGKNGKQTKPVVGARSRADWEGGKRRHCVQRMTSLEKGKKTRRNSRKD